MTSLSLQSLISGPRRGVRTLDLWVRGQFNESAVVHVQCAEPVVTGVIVTDLTDLFALLVVAYGVVMSPAALVPGWRLFCGRQSVGYWRGGQVPPGDATRQSCAGAR